MSINNRKHFKTKKMFMLTTHSNFYIVIAEYLQTKRPSLEIKQRAIVIVQTNHIHPQNLVAVPSLTNLKLDQSQKEKHCIHIKRK